MKEEIAHWMQ